MTPEQLKHFSNILANGTTLTSKGTTSEGHSHFQTPAKLVAAAKAGCLMQNITKDSRMYTVLKTQHAGGLGCTILPALWIGAEQTIEDFNAYAWVRNINKYTHSHLTPTHAQAILMTKGFYNLDLTGITIGCGSTPVSWDIVEAFVKQGCNFVSNWGMTEVGPCAIGTIFHNMKEVEIVQEFAPEGTTIIGNKCYLDTKLVDGELHVRGDISVFGDEWFATGDMMTQVNGYYFYVGRKNRHQ